MHLEKEGLFQTKLYMQYPYIKFLYFEHCCWNKYKKLWQIKKIWLWLSSKKRWPEWIWFWWELHPPSPAIYFGSTEHFLLQETTLFVAEKENFNLPLRKTTQTEKTASTWQSSASKKVQNPPFSVSVYCFGVFQCAIAAYTSCPLSTIYLFPTSPSFSFLTSNKHPHFSHSSFLPPPISL